MKARFLFLALGLLMASTAFASDFDLQKSTFVAAVFQKNSQIGILFNTRSAWGHGSQALELEEEERMELDIVTAVLHLCHVDRVRYTSCKTNRTIEQIKTDLMSQGVAIDESFQKSTDAAVAR